MLRLLLKPLAWLSLSKLHLLGKWLGLAIYFASPYSKSLIRKNLIQAGFYKSENNTSAFAKANLQEIGKSIVESLAIWQKPKPEVLSWVKSTSNWNVVDNAIKRGNGIIFLTPHMGCFEITSLYYGNSHPITILFRPPKRKWLSILSAAGRSNGKIKQAPANSSGVRMLLQALKNGEAIGILPDQIPAKGEGEWAPFFGQPAYTMTLVSKLANKTGATVIMAFGERLTDGRGFTVHLNELIDGSVATTTMLNRAIEEQIKQKPHQYLWAYPRYKTRGRLINKPIE